MGTTAPWLLEQGVDVVARLDAAKPWLVDSSWNVAEDIPDVFSNANPQAVIVGAGDKAYVLPYLRNAISVIDTSSAVDGGLPLKTIDLSALVQAGEMCIRDSSLPRPRSLLRPLSREEVDRGSELVLAVPWQCALLGRLAEATVRLTRPAREDPALRPEPAVRRRNVPLDPLRSHPVEHRAQSHSGLAAQAGPSSLAFPRRP